MWLEILLGTIACEAMVQLWFDAAPLAWVREFMVKHLHLLYSRRMSKHGLNCKYCTSMWVALLLTYMYFINHQLYMVVCILMTIHRVPSYIHVMYSMKRDMQIELRVARNVRHERMKREFGIGG